MIELVIRFGSQKWTALGACVLLGFVSASVSAERFITIPIAKKIPFKGASLSYLWEQGAPRTEVGTLGLGITQVLDVELIYERFPGEKDKLGFGVSYNVTDPIVGIGPGLTVGLRDAFDDTSDGISGYVVTTYALGNEDLHNQDTNSLISLGFLVDRRGAKIFTGLSQPITNRFLIVTEHNSKHLTGGFEFRPVPEGSIRWLHRQSGQMWQISFQQRF